jgi:hypothetical protein
MSHGHTHDRLTNEEKRKVLKETREKGQNMR